MEQLSADAEDFDVNQYIKGNLDVMGDGNKHRKLRELRNRIQAVADESSQSIKKNVFQNYNKFIETAKEISFLEGEMYQLNHLLGEQKRLIEQIQEMSFSGNAKDRSRGHSTSTEVDKRKSMQNLLEKVEGAAHLAENPNRCVIIESDLTQLNPDTNTPIRNLRGFLLNDGFMITTWIAQRLGPMRYKYETVFPLDNLAVVNVKDSGEAKNAFKLLVFPEHKYFSCENPRLKRQWLDSIESCKRQMLLAGSLVRQATIRSKKRSDKNALSLSSKEKAPDIYSDERKSSGLEDGSSEMEWLRELPDELDVCMAQRDFDAAVELLFEGRENLSECGDGPVAREVKEKLTQKERQLVEVLGKELKVAASNTMQGGPKAARKAITLMIKLGKSSQACDLYLKNRSAVIKQSVKEVRIAEDPLSYLKQLSRIVFGNLSDVAQEFAKLFAANAGCCSVLVLWASGEMNNFINLVLRHIFDPRPGLAVLGQSLQSTITNSLQLASLGLDLTFEVEKLMTPEVKKAIQLNGQNFVDAIRLRISEEKWKPNNLQSEANMLRFLEEMSDIGLKLESYICDDQSDRCRLWVTASVCHFSRTILPLSRDLPPLRLPELKQLCDETLTGLWKLQLQHITQALALTNKHKQQEKVIEKSAKFLVTQVLPLCQNIYTDGLEMDEGEWTLIDDLLETSSFDHLKRFREGKPQFEDIGDV